MSVKQILKQLVAVQAIDLQILDLKKMGEVYPTRLGQLEADVATYRAKLDAERTRLGDNEQSRRTKEAEIAEERDKVRKWEARLADQRTTREYSALAREIDIVVKHIQNMDLELKGLLALVPDIRASIETCEADLQKRLAETAAERESLQTKLAHFNQEFETLQAQRAATAEGLDRAQLARYDMVRAKRGSGLAMVMGGICKGCNLRLPPQLQNVLRAGASLQSCPSCNRFICTPEMVD